MRGAAQDPPIAVTAAPQGAVAVGSNINWGRLTGDRLPPSLGIKVGVLAAACVPPPRTAMKVLQAVSSPWRAAQQQPSPKEAHPITRRGVEQLPMGKRGGGKGGGRRAPRTLCDVLSAVLGGGPPGSQCHHPQSGAQGCRSDSQHVDLTMQHRAGGVGDVPLGVTTSPDPTPCGGGWGGGGTGWVKGRPCSPGAFHQDPNPNEPQPSKDKAELRNYTVRGSCGAGERP